MKKIGKPGNISDWSIPKEFSPWVSETLFTGNHFHGLPATVLSNKQKPCCI